MKRKIFKIPGPNAVRILTEHAKYAVTSTNGSPFVPLKANGVYVTNVDGDTVLDFTSGVGVSNIGYDNDAMRIAMAEQSRTGLYQFINSDYVNPKPVELMKKLVEIAPNGNNWRVFLANSGAEAVEAAIKIAFANQQGREIIAMEGAFHGRTGYCLPLMGSKSVHRAGFPMAYTCHHITYPTKENAQRSWEDLEHIFTRYTKPENVAAIIFECVQGEGGIQVPDKAMLRKITRFCQEKGILIIDDEIQTGFGRTGKMWACQHFDIFPDIITCAKALTSGGAPGSATFVRRPLNLEQGQHSNTFGGNLMASVSALATIEVIENEGLVGRSREMGEKLACLLQDICDHHDCAVSPRGMGLMRAIDIVDKNGKPSSMLRDGIVHEALVRGLLLIGCGNPMINSGIRFLPPLIIEEEHLIEMHGILDEAIEVATKTYL